MKYDVAIIGSGLGGLECAHILASAGLHVVVIERAHQPGGCMQSYRRDGMTFDTGFHSVGGLAEGQPLHEAFSRLGLLRLPWQRLDAEATDIVTIGKRSFRFSEGYDCFAETLAETFPHQREQLRHYVRMLASVHDLSSDETVRLMQTNAYEWFEKTFSDRLLVNVLSGGAIRMELRKESTSLFDFLHCNSGYVASSWRLRGSSSLIVSSLTDDIRSMGGEIVCDAEVVRMTLHDGRAAEAVCHDGRRFAADTFISDAHPSATCSWFDDSRVMRGVYRRRIANLANTFGMFTASLVLKPQTVVYFNHNKFVYRDNDVWDFYKRRGGVGGVMVSYRVPEQSGFATQIDLLTPMRQDEYQQWEGTKTSRRGDDYRRMKERKAQECIRLAETVLPGIGQNTATVLTSTPLTYRDYTLTPDGSAFGVRKDCRDAMATRLSVHTPIPNLLLTGQSIGVHGVEGVTMTSLRTCNEIIKRKGI